MSQPIKALRLACIIPAFAAMFSACTANVSTDADLEIGTVQEPVVWDGVGPNDELKPIPKKNLFRQAVGTECCPSSGATAGQCGPCSTDDGLATAFAVDKAADYYKASTQDTLTTLQKWESFFGFGDPGVDKIEPRPGESLAAFRKRAGIVIYYNITELGLGRELGCNSQSSDKVACYVTNYGESFNNMFHPDLPDASPGLKDAVQRVRRKNTVVISYISSRPAGHRVQFAAYGWDDKLLKTAQLDYMGSRPIPQICTTCHGGNWDKDASHNGASGLADGARFLPLITSTVKFSNNAPYRREDQEENIRIVNQYAWKIRDDSLTTRQRSLLGENRASDTLSKGLYAPNGDTLGWRNPSDPRQFAEDAVPTRWLQDRNDTRELYNKVALRFCDTCHLAGTNATAVGGGILMDQAVGSYNDFTSRLWSDVAQNNLGWEPNGFCSGRFNADQANWDALPMPHSQPALARFWGDRTDGTNLFTPRMKCHDPAFPACKFNCGAPGCSDMVLGFASPVEYLFWFIGMWCQNGEGIQPDALPFWMTTITDTGSWRCGQTSSLLSGSASTDAAVGANSGRNASLDTAQCVDACKSALFDVNGETVLCPGSEKTSIKTINSQFGPRQECRNVSTSDGVGSCVSCGRYGEPACLDVGSSCNQLVNPHCNVAPQCHEGSNQSGVCKDSNLSQGKTASQSTTNGSYTASRAVDGNTNGALSGGSVSRTNGESSPWWKVDLGGTRTIRKIEIFNRTDCSSTTNIPAACEWFRLNNFKVERSTDNSTWSTVGKGAAGTNTDAVGDFTNEKPATSGVTTIQPHTYETARYIRIRLNSCSGTGCFSSDGSSRVLNISEVKVWGW